MMSIPAVPTNSLSWFAQKSLEYPNFYRNVSILSVHLAFFHFKSSFLIKNHLHSDFLAEWWSPSSRSWIFRRGHHPTLPPVDTKNNFEKLYNFQYNWLLITFWRKFRTYLGPQKVRFHFFRWQGWPTILLTDSLLSTNVFSLRPRNSQR